MRESRSNDLFILGHVALEATIRTEADLAELLNDSARTRAHEPVRTGALRMGDGFLV
jgi:hypothetical protein